MGKPERPGHRRGRRTVTMCGAPCARSRPDGQPRRTMPTYAYRCTACEHAFEIHQAFTDDALTTCPECSGALRKLDRKSTRLNSSHVKISYAVFCLKKKN